MRRIVLTSVRLAKPDRPDPPKDKADARATPIVDQAAVMHKSKLGLGLPDSFILFKGLVEGADKARLYKNVVIQEEQVCRSIFLDGYLCGCVSSSGNTKIALTVMG
jgi:hypothetical protein